MKNLLLLALLLTSAVSFSQLYVAPNTTTSTDSYIFVNDQVLFVEQDVNLVLNTNNAATEASIYLRNDSQLIQGTTASNNSGNGMLSVYQDTPNDDAYDYTLWASPVGTNAGGAGNTNFGALHFYEPTGLTTSNQATTTSAWNGVISPMAISTRWLYKLVTPGTEAEGNYIALGAGNNVPAGYGFTMKGLGVGNHNQNYDFRGRPNNGTFTIPVGNGLMTLSGNPYPSALDLAAVFEDNPDLGAIWYWDEDRTINSHQYLDNRGGYGAWVPAGCASSDLNCSGSYTQPTFTRWDAAGNSYPAGGATGASYARRYAPIGQGFMLVGNTAGNVTIQNSQRVFVKESDPNSEFRNTENSRQVATSTSPGAIIIDNGGGDDNGDDNTNENEDLVPQIRLITVFGESHSREMLLLFSDLTTDGYDQGWDALHPMDASSESYFPIGNDNDRAPYVIEGVPFNIEKQIPIAFKLNQQFKFLVESIETINFNKHTYIWDRIEDTYQEITYGREAVFNLPAGDYDNRFFLVFRDQRAAAEASEGTKETNRILSNVDFFQNNPAQQLEITNPEGYEIKSAQFFDMSGKLVYNQQNLGNNQKLTLPTGNLSDGVYLVKLTTVDNVGIDYKMIIHNK